MLNVNAAIYLLSKVMSELSSDKVQGITLTLVRGSDSFDNTDLALQQISRGIILLPLYIKCLLTIPYLVPKTELSNLKNQAFCLTAKHRHFYLPFYNHVGVGFQVTTDLKGVTVYLTSSTQLPEHHNTPRQNLNTCHGKFLF